MCIARIKNRIKIRLQTNKNDKRQRSLIVFGNERETSIDELPILNLTGFIYTSK